MNAAEAHLRRSIVGAGFRFDEQAGDDLVISTSDKPSNADYRVLQGDRGLVHSVTLPCDYPQMIGELGLSVQGRELILSAERLPGRFPERFELWKVILATQNLTTRRTTCDSGILGLWRNDDGTVLESCTSCKIDDLLTNLRRRIETRLRKSGSGLHRLLDQTLYFMRHLGKGSGELLPFAMNPKLRHQFPLLSVPVAGGEVMYDARRKVLIVRRAGECVSVLQDAWISKFKALAEAAAELGLDAALSRFVPLHTLTAQDAWDPIAGRLVVPVAVDSLPASEAAACYMARAAADYAAAYGGADASEVLFS